MDRTTPLATIISLVNARLHGDIDAAVTAYEPMATVVLQPGRTASGASAIRAFTKVVIGLSLSFSDRQIIAGDDVALHFSRWSAATDDGSRQEQASSGWTADVLRRQSDGLWLFTIDNPWAAAMLGREPRRESRSEKQG